MSEANAQVMEDIERMMKELDEEEQKFNDAKDRIRNLREIHIPTAIRSITTDGGEGPPVVKIGDGRMLYVRHKFHVDVNKADMEPLAAWMQDNGFADLVRTVVTMDCGRGSQFRMGVFRKAIVEAITTLQRETKQEDIRKTEFKWGAEEKIHGTVLKNWAIAMYQHGKKLPEMVKVFDMEEVIVEEPPTGYTGGVEPGQPREWEVGAPEGLLMSGLKMSPIGAGPPYDDT